jgi:hypothetical protein
MKKTVQTLQIIFIAAFFAFICHGFASGNMMIIIMKDGRTMNVPVSKDDIVSLSFDETSGPSSDDISWDFESSDLRGWTKTGDAFTTQPTYGDNPTARILWDVTPYSGQNAQIRLVDAASGGWGHINFDDVKFE